MMTKQLECVFNDVLAVYRIKNLRVCDASIMSMIPRRNSLSSVYALSDH
jgi:choline dehydrogenase-like flavoprotein